MQSLKSVFGVVGALAAVLYCGGLLYYFLNLSGSFQEAQAIGLGPTVLGLGAIGLLFVVVLIVRVVWLFVASRTPASSGRSGSGAATHDDESGFDADAVIARHMARRSTEGASDSPTAPSPREGGDPAGRPTFGRRTR